jgi:hypothetical protein
MALPTLWDSLDIAAIAIPNTTTSSNGFPKCCDCPIGKGFTTHRKKQGHDISSVKEKQPIPSGELT